MPGNVEEIYKLSISRLPTEQYDHTILSLLVRCLFISRGKHLAQHCLSLFPLFEVRVANNWFLALKELLHDLSPQNEEKQYGRQIHPFSFERSPLLTNIEHLFRQTNS